MPKTRLIAITVAALALAGCGASTTAPDAEPSARRADEAPTCRGPGLTMGGGYSDLPPCPPTP